MRLLTCCKLANLPWNFVTAASKQHPKTTRRLRLMLQKTGKQRCKNPGVPSVDRGNWGWECECSLFVNNAAFWDGLRLIRSPHLQGWRSFFGMVRSTNDNDWKPPKYAKFMLVLTSRLQNSRIFCERERRTIFDRKVWSEGEWWETLKNTAVRHAYIKFVQNYPFFQQREIHIGPILTQPVIKCQSHLIKKI